MIETFTVNKDTYTQYFYLSSYESHYDANDNFDENVTNTITQSNWILTAPCGEQWSYQSEELFKQYFRVRAEEHEKSCRACDILRGDSKATVLNQQEIARLFTKGIDGKHSSTNNYESKDGILMHYRTIEGIRTNDNLIIGNTQCFSRGFATCSLRAETKLPLSSLGEFVQSDDLKKIHIEEHTKEYTLFSDTDIQGLHYYLFGHDEGRPFLVRLAEPSITIADALEKLKPLEARGRTDVTRQGDLFFIPVNMGFGIQPLYKLDKAHFVEIEKTIPNWQTDDDKEKTIKSKKLYMPEIKLDGDSVRHSAKEILSSGYSTDPVYVRGCVTHPQHKKITLSSWCLVKRNTATLRIDASRRSFGGAD